MAFSTDEVLAGLAELITDETGIATDDGRARTSRSPTTSTSTRSR